MQLSLGRSMKCDFVGVNEVRNKLWMTPKCFARYRVILKAPTDEQALGAYGLVLMTLHLVAEIGLCPSSSDLNGFNLLASYTVGMEN